MNRTLTPTADSRQAELIRARREALGLSQEQLAASSGVDIARIASAEAGGALDLRSLYALAAELELPLTARAEAARKAGDDASRRQHDAIWVVVLLFLCLFMGYQVGKDLAVRDNVRDCIAAGRTDCGVPD